MERERVRQAAMQRIGSPESPKQPDQGLQSARKKVVQSINGDLLDYRHCSLQALAACVAVLLRICRNVVEHPDEKFRQVKISNSKLQAQIAVNAAAAEKVLFAAGWSIAVYNMEKHYCFSGEPGSKLYGQLLIAVEELQDAEKLLIDKQQRGGSTKQARDKEEAARREAALMQFQDDRETRRLKVEQQQAAQAATELATLLAKHDTEGRPDESTDSKKER